MRRAVSETCACLAPFSRELHVSILPLAHFLHFEEFVHLAARRALRRCRSTRTTVYAEFVSLFLTRTSHLTKLLITAADTSQHIILRALCCAASLFLNALSHAVHHLLLNFSTLLFLCRVSLSESLRSFVRRD